jgi:cytochrome bd ubiquinol oxidase subunit II
MTLAELWFVLIAVLWVGFLVMEGFDFGVGILHGVIGRTEVGRRTVLGTIGPVWDGNEVWLIVAAAAMFAAFPGWYATMFSALYPVLILLLVALILRGVALVFLGKRESRQWRRTWSAALTAGSLLAPLLVGLALGDLLHGLPVGAGQEYVGGFVGLLPPYALYAGLTVVVLCLLHGALFVVLKTRGEVRGRAAGIARALGPATAAVVVGFAVWTQVMAGRGAGAWLVEAIAAVAALVAARYAGRGRDGAAFAASAVTMAAVVATFFVDLHPRVLVSTLGPAYDLTILNTSSASYSLTVMTWVAAVLLPFVLGYQAWSYHVFRQRLGGSPVAVTPPVPIPSPRTSLEQQAGDREPTVVTDPSGRPPAAPR